MGDFLLRNRRLLGVGTDALDERLDYSSWMMIGARRG